MPLKVMTVVGTRPEIIKLSRVIKEIESQMSHVLVHTGQNFDYELNEVFFRDLELRSPQYFLDVAKDSLSPAETIGKTLIKIDEVIEKEKPDAVLFYGDTNSCLSVIAFKKRKIPIFHLESGNRCFDQRVPEEVNRKIIDHLSDINFVHSEHARRYLIREGISQETIIKTGSPMSEIFNIYGEKIDRSSVLEKLNLLPQSYFVVSTHREENVDSDENFQQLLMSLNSIAEKYKKKIIVSTHPRTKKKLENVASSHSFSSLIDFMKPLGFLDYVKLEKEAYCVLSDSGTITEESSILKFPAVMIRQAHERPEGMDVGAVVMSGLNCTRIIDSIDMVVSQKQNGKNVDPISDYDKSNFSVQVVRVIQSYTDYINRVVWHKKI